MVSRTTPTAVRRPACVRTNFVLASIIIPVAPYHRDLAQRAALSATLQTVRCEVIVIEDREGKGAGWARNRGIEQASGLFCVFLDADDLLEPEFVAASASAYTQGRYVYTDFFLDGMHKQTSDCASWFNGLWHPITTLFPTQAVRYLGGFDEDLPGGEDREFYLKAVSAGICGVRVPRPLMHYTSDGQRSQDWIHSPRYNELRAAIDKRYIPKMCSPSCSGGLPTPVLLDDGQEGDVIAVALYAPCKQFGIASGRIYKRPLYQGQEMKVDPRDVQASPELWAIKADPIAITPDVESVLRLAQAAR